MSHVWAADTAEEPVLASDLVRTLQREVTRLRDTGQHEQLCDRCDRAMASEGRRADVSLEALQVTLEDCQYALRIYRPALERVKVLIAEACQSTMPDVLLVEALNTIRRALALEE